jgi:hypothetical protein
LATGSSSGNLAGFFDHEESGATEAALVFLANRSETDWVRIVDRTERRRFVAGEEVIRAGDDDRSLLILVYDLLSARRLTRHKDGRRVLIGRAELVMKGSAVRVRESASFTARSRGFLASQRTSLLPVGN